LVYSSTGFRLSNDTCRY